MLAAAGFGQASPLPAVSADGCWSTPPRGAAGFFSHRPSCRQVVRPCGGRSDLATGGRGGIGGASQSSIEVERRTIGVPVPSTVAPVGVVTLLKVSAMKLVLMHRIVGALEPSTVAPAGVVTVLKAWATKFALLPKSLRGKP